MRVLDFGVREGSQSHAERLSPVPETSFTNRFGWALKCAWYAWQASRNGRVVVPVVMGPVDASLIVGEGIPLKQPIVRLHAEKVSAGYKLVGTTPHLRAVS